MQSLIPLPDRGACARRASPAWLSPNLGVVRDALRITRGDFYEDCRYHPMLCVAVNHDHDELLGISLVVGGNPGACSATHCGAIPMTPEEAIERALGWDDFAREHDLPTRAEALRLPG